MPHLSWFPRLQLHLLPADSHSPFLPKTQILLISKQVPPGKSFWLLQPQSCPLTLFLQGLWLFGCIVQVSAKLILPSLLPGNASCCPLSPDADGSTQRQSLSLFLAFSLPPLAHTLSSIGLVAEIPGWCVPFRDETKRGESNVLSTEMRTLRPQRGSDLPKVTR